MKDIFGRELYIGDEVAVTPKNYRGLVKATVIDFTPKQVRVGYMNTWNFGGNGVPEQYLVYPDYLAKRGYETE